MERRRQDLNLQIQRTLVFETSAIPGYATSARVAPGGQGPLGDAPKWRPYFALSVQVRVLFRPRRQADAAVTLPAGSTVGDLLRVVRESPDSTLAVRGSTPVPEGEALVDGEEILLLSAFSGG